MTFSCQEVFGEGGPVAGVLGTRYEPRAQQSEMASAVERAMEEKACLLVEAGTGVGKSFAYLVPAIRRIVDAAGGERIVVATNTIALQEQLVQKDVPLLKRVFGIEDEKVLRAELVKGRGNYLSIRRLTLALGRQDRLFTDPASRRSIQTIEQWAYKTTDGSLSTLPVLERPGVWDRAQSDSGNCMGRRCPTYDRCFYQRARQRMERANLLICNHALFFSDLALRRHGTGFLPDYQHVILDEAHNLEDVASDHFGLSLSEGRVRHLVSLLVQPRRQRGFLATVRTGDDGAAIQERAHGLALTALSTAEEFFEGLVQRVSGEVGSVRLPPGKKVENTLTPAFRELSLALRRLKESTKNEEDKYELNSYAQRAADIAEEAEALCGQALPGCAYWVEVSAGDGRAVRSTLACSPVEVAPILKEALFAGQFSVTMTSATLTAARGSFDHTIARLGCEGARTMCLGSPFDHSRQTELHIDTNLPDPRSGEYEGELARRVVEHVSATEGGAFVLFTSYRTMNAVGDAVRGELEERGLRVFVQGKDGPRSEILEKFRGDERGVLIGTTSFWQGVDVPGRALRNVIITRLPFEPPDRPLTQARHEMIEARGGDPFFEDSLPRAIVRFKQGFGRLIRSATDTGRVVVLDRRIVSAGYGKLFLEALPEGVRVIVNGSEEARVGVE